MTIPTLIRAALAALLFTAPTVTAASAHDFKVGEIEIGHPWARATAPSAPTGATFLDLANHGKTADRLTGASSPVAATVELHTHLMEDNVMKMRPVDGIDVAPGAHAKLAPGGLHIMLIGLKEPLKKGQTFPLTLTFEQAGPVTVEVTVQGPGDREPEHDHGHSHD